MMNERLLADPNVGSTGSTIDVRCRDKLVRDTVRDWLDRGRLRPPVGLTIEIDVVDILHERHDDRPVFRQPTVEIHTGPPDESVCISWTAAPAVAKIPNDSSTAQVTLSTAARDRMPECLSTFLTTVFVFLVRRVGWHHLHAATAVTPTGRGWLIAGNAGAGKSTTTAVLASMHWPIGTDDNAFLVRQGDRVVVVGERRPIALRDGGRALLRAGAGVFHERRSKTLYWPEELGATWVPQVCPDVLLFATVGDRTTVEPLGTQETLAALVRWSAWVILEPQRAQEHLDLLAHLGRQARSFRATLGSDLFERPARLLELIE